MGNEEITEWMQCPECHDTFIKQVDWGYYYKVFECQECGNRVEDMVM